MEQKYAFNTAAYRTIFSKFMPDGERTREDEILADMEEPRGMKISLLPVKYTHHVTACKAFAATTTAGRLLVAVFDLYGKFYECYHMQMKELQNVAVKKAFGGMNISFYGNTQFGRLNMQMYIPNHQFGTDLKEQKNHSKLFIQHLLNKNTAAEWNENKEDYEITSIEIAEKTADFKQDSEKTSADKAENKKCMENPMQNMFEEIIRLSDILEENGINFVKCKEGIKEERLKDAENELLLFLPEDYRNILLLSNGLTYGGTEIYPIERVRKIELPDNPEMNKYYIIGAYIGDGSHIVTDNKGAVYYLDHVNGIEETTFIEFINTWLLDIMKDDLMDNGIDEI